MKDKLMQVLRLLLHMWWNMPVVSAAGGDLI
jgi:hypothetical protein